MDRVNRYFCLFRRSELMNAMAKIKNMSVRISGIIKKTAYSGPQLVLGQEQGKGIEVALHGSSPHLLYGIADGNTPIEANDVGS